MANSISHAALGLPVRGARFTLSIPYLDADGDPTDPTTPDTEVSLDGAAFADCTEEVATISGSNGMGYLTLTGDELDASMVCLAAKSASGPKTTLAMLTPRVLPVVHSGTAQGGAAGSITLAASAAAVDGLYCGCVVKTTAGTGAGGGNGSRDNQARVITAYVGASRVASVVPDWETAPANDTTYEILLTEMAATAATAAQTSADAAKTSADAAKTSADTAAANAAKVSALVETASGGYDRFKATALEQAPSGGLSAQGVRDAMKLAPSAGDAATGSLDADLDALAQAVGAIGGQTGSGALDVTVTCRDSLGNPLDGVAVWIATDQAGTNVVAGTKYTIADGTTHFQLDEGTYWVFRQLAGYEFDPNPAQISVS